MAPLVPFAKRNRPVTQLLLDFTKEYRSGHFNPFLGLEGELRSDGDGLEIDTRVFATTEPFGPRGSFDRYKCAPYYNKLIEFNRRNETLMKARISVKQVFDSQKPLPREYHPRVKNIKADPRLCHGFFGFFDPKTGIHVYILGTDDQWFLNYGRDDNLSGCTYYGRGSASCQPCVEKKSEFSRANFADDPDYKKFKRSLLQDDFTYFDLFKRWTSYAGQNGLDVFDWKLFGEWKSMPGQCIMMPPQAYVAWKSVDNHDDYCIFVNFNLWYTGYKEWYACNESSDCGASACSTGSCTIKKFGPGCTSCGGSAANPICSHRYTTGTNCYEDEVEHKERYPYEFTSRKSCCRSRIATFEDIIPLELSQACDPGCDFVDVTIGVVRGAESTAFHIYMNNQLVHTINSAGRRQAEQFRVIERGGYGADLDVDSGLLVLGTGTLVDAALPDNYWRALLEKGVAESALTPVMPTNMYNQIVKDKLGQLKPVVAEQTFAIPASTPESRLFGQGAVLKCRYISVMTRDFVSAIGYESPINWNKTPCCGMSLCSSNPGDAGCISGSCEVPVDDLFDWLNLEDRYDIMLDPPRKPVRGDDALPRALGGAGGAGGAGVDFIHIRARLVRKSKGELWNSRSCGTDFIGNDPYMH